MITRDDEGQKQVIVGVKGESGGGNQLALTLGLCSLISYVIPNDSGREKPCHIH